MSPQPCCRAWRGLVATVPALVATVPIPVATVPISAATVPAPSRSLSPAALTSLCKGTVPWGTQGGKGTDWPLGIHFNGGNSS